MSFWRKLFGGNVAETEALESDAVSDAVAQEVEEAMSRSFPHIEKWRGAFDSEQLTKVRAKWLGEVEDPPKPETRELSKLLFDGTVDESKCIKLIQAGANPNVQATYVPTGLILACEKGLSDLVKVMLEHGAFPDQRGSYEHTALCNALSDGHTEIAMMLIEAGANVNTTGNSRFTPLIVAASQGNEPIVIELMKRGADAEYRVPPQYGGMNAEETAKHKDYNSTAEIIRRLKSTHQPEVSINHGAKYPDHGDAYYDEFFAAQCRIVRVID